MDLLHYLSQADAVARTVAIVMLLMSIASWVVIVMKFWALRTARRTVLKSIGAFWQNPELAEAKLAAQAFDTHQWLAPLLAVVDSQEATRDGNESQRGARLTRLLREGKNELRVQLEFGQVVLATVGATAPFVGLLGTVWGIYLALSTIAGAGVISIDQVAGPVGESLIMTAAGLAVALPAVLAYNLFNRQIAYLVGKVDGFAYDLRERLLG